MIRLKEIIFTVFYSGYFPIASGTAGTAVGMGIYICEYIIFGQSSWIVNIVVVILMLYPAIKIGDAGEEFFGVKDPPEVVLDEVMGYWISVLFFPFSLKIALIAFVIFRIMDIIKPFPAKRLQNLKGGLGIMIDDYIAGVYTNLTLILLINVLKIYDISIY